MVNFFRDEVIVHEEHFGICDDANYKHRLAYVCNKSHPAFQVSMKERMQKFKNIHNIRLIICRDINLK